MYSKHFRLEMYVYTAAITIVCCVIYVFGLQ